MTYVLAAAGLTLLIIGGNLLVRGGSALATRLGISPLVIGLTVVSIGTSVPELAVGVDAALRGATGLVTGNIVGTNIVNLLLILGLSAALRPIEVMRQTVRLDVPVVAVVAVVLVLLSLGGSLNRPEGLILLALGVVYTVTIVRYTQRRGPQVQARYEAEVPGARDGQADPAADPAPRRESSSARDRASGTLADTVRLVAGIALVVLGADWLVGGAVEIAAALGVSDALIGLTIVAIGTSAPELVTTVVATIKGQRALAIGNLIGSSVYNIVLILGLTVVVSPGPIEVPADVLRVDMVVMAAVAVLLIPTVLSGRRISRVEGVLMVAAYAGYLAYLVLART